MLIFLGTAIAVLLAGTWISISFFREGSSRPAVIMSVLTLAAAAVFTVIALVFPETGFWAATAVAGLVLVFSLLFFLPFGNRDNAYKSAVERFDERDIMFARARYRPGDGRYEDYYAGKPQVKKRDDFTRSLPDLGEAGGSTWDRLNPQIAGSIFSWIERVRDTVEGPVNPHQEALTAAEATRRLTGLARFLGAADAGTTSVSAEHVYSHIGRGAGKWGDTINPADHQHALVFTVEMKPEYMGRAPLQPELADSGRQYLEAAKIAFAVAEYIRSLGYKARAHVDGNYQLIMPTIAVEAGLGEIGRHSLLITPRQGTRVRIAAVTTELPLQQAERLGFGVNDFCTICKKCAVNCPSNSIPKQGKKELRGTEYWKIDEESCFRMWRSYGTDCGICVNVCPYSRPGGGIHGLVRLACRQNPVSRRFFHTMDDFFYGKRPRDTSLPEWMRV